MPIKPALGRSTSSRPAKAGLGFKKLERERYQIFSLKVFSICLAGRVTQVARASV
jgi:hypothetical protein